MLFTTKVFFPYQNTIMFIESIVLKLSIVALSLFVKNAITIKKRFSFVKHPQLNNKTKAGQYRHEAAKKKQFTNL